MPKSGSVSITKKQKEQIARICGNAVIKALEETLITGEIGQKIIDSQERLMSLVQDAVEKFICQISIEMRDGGGRKSEPVVKDLLNPAGAVSVPIIAGFNTRDRFTVDTSEAARVNISYVGDDFKKWFGAMKVASHCGSNLSYHTLTRNAYDREILTTLGGEANVEIRLAEIMWLMEQQREGEAGVLLTNGYANIFYIRDKASVLRAVYVNWYGNGWHVNADELDDNRWLSPRRVFSRGVVPALESDSCS